MADTGRPFVADLRAALAGKSLDYTSGPMARGIWLLAIPMVVEMAMESLFAIVDIWFLNKLGKEAVAAVGLTEALMTLCYAIGIGLCMPLTATVARRVGEKDLRGGAVAAVQGIALGGVLGIVLGLPAIVAAPDLLRLMGADEAVVEVGSGYTAWLLGGNAIVMLLFVQNAVFRGAGDPTLAMRSLWLANGINLVLDPALIFGWGPFPELGVTGAAIATCIGRGFGVGYQTWMLFRGRCRVQPAPADLRLDLAAMSRLMQLSVGGVGQFLIATSSWVVLMRIVAPHGSEAAAGYTVGIRILMFAFLPAWGFSNAVATLVGQNLGAGQPGRAEQATWLAGWYTMWFLAGVTLVMELLPWPLVAFFTDDPGVQAHAVDSLRIIAAGYVFYAWGITLVQAFNGAGDTWTPTLLNLLCFWVLEIPLAMVLSGPAGLGPQGVFWSVMLSESVLAVLSLVAFRRGRWKTRIV